MLTSQTVIIGDSSVKKDLDSLNASEKAKEKLLIYWQGNKKVKKLKGKLSGLYAIKFPMENNDGRLVFFPFRNSNLIYIGAAGGRNDIYKKAGRKITTMKAAINTIQEHDLSSII